MVKIINDNSQKVLSDMEKAVERGLQAIGLMCETYAKDNCPVDTGRLRNSITFVTPHKNDVLHYAWTDSTKGRGTKAGEGETIAKGAAPDRTVVIGTNVEYAPFVELGAGGQKAHHFLGRAAQEHMDEYMRLMRDSIKNS